MTFCSLVYLSFSDQLVRGPVLFPNTAFVPNNPNVVRHPFPDPNIRPPQPIYEPYPSMPRPFNPTPIIPDQPFIPTPIIPDRPLTPPHIIPNPSSPPATSDLMDRMRQVQMLMVEIHLLENVPPAEQNTPLIQELKRRVMELSNTDGNVPTDASLDSRAPPPYVPREDGAGERPQHGDGSG